MKTSHFFTAVCFGLITLSSALVSRAAPPAVPADSSPSESSPTQIAALAATQVVAHPTTFHVTMTTSLVIPDKKQVSELRIWHALPDGRPWSTKPAVTGADSGADNVHFAPATGVQEFAKEHLSHHTVWREKKIFAPHTALSFTTQYEVRSVDREFKPSAIQTQWPGDFVPPTDIEPTIARVADEIRQRCEPASAVLEFSKLIKRDIRYDASVPYRASDVASTIAQQRGHCGHMYQVFAQLCRRVGIPVRDVRGLCLYAPDGQSKLTNLNPGWTNIHTWAEVYFSEVGWVEVEPSYGEKAFSIPAKFIQNNKWFQNYAVWVREDGKLIMPAWTVDDVGVHSSEYQISNLIKFSTES